MKKLDNDTKFSIQLILTRIAILIVATTVLVYFMPREGKFRYFFQEGKPWKYGLLTAPFDFPVYKTDADIEKEQDSIMANFHPYFSINYNIGSSEIKKLDEDYASKKLMHLRPSDYNYLKDALKQIYSAGIISSKNHAEFKNDSVVSVISNNLSRLRNIATIYTEKTAYLNILDNSKDKNREARLQKTNIEEFIKPNLSFDEKMTEKVRVEYKQRLSLSSGLIQTGERIVDRGEIIDNNTYNILRSLEMSYAKRAGSANQQWLTLTGQVIVVLLALGSILIFLALYRKEMFDSLRDVGLIFFMIVTMLIACSFMGHFRLLSIYMVPISMVPIIIRTFLDSRTAFFAYIITVLISSFIAPFAFEFFFIQTAVGIASLFNLKELTQRSQLARVAAFVFITYSTVYTSYTLIMEGTLDKINPSMFMFFLINSAALLFTYLLVFILEKMFGFMSNVTLVELSNINSPLLRRLSEECPGTFQHSIQMSNLCALAARKIGANVLLVRTAALYHDIGKLYNPSFFTENQQGINPHDNLTTEQSVDIIRKHVTEGVKLAQKEKLPNELISFIETHHGRGKMKFFYNRWKNENPDKEIDESIFEYPGPNPYTKEQALLMITDCVEAASRSLKEYSEESCSRLINQLIEQIINDGMLNNTPLTFRDLEAIRQVYLERLLSMYHTRVSYPELKQSAE